MSLINGGAGYNTEFSDSSSEGSGSSSVDAIEDGAVAGDYGVYHVGLEFNLLSPEVIHMVQQKNHRPSQLIHCHKTPYVSAHALLYIGCTSQGSR